MYYFQIFFPIAFFYTLCCGGCIYFFWYFRRRPDEVELAVLASDIKIGESRQRVVFQTSSAANKNDDEYPS